MSTPAARVAIIGAGMAGATCARSLADAGLQVRLFDESRGVGGRMATRRVEWSTADGVEHRSRFDHGAPGFSAHSPGFARFAGQAHRDGLLERWLPATAPGSYVPLGDPALWVPVPDMPALCRGLLSGLPVQTDCSVRALLREPGGWRVEVTGPAVAAGFNAVVVAVPQPQAAPLLRPHQADWAHRAQALSMLPGWTLMGVTDELRPAPAWGLAWPTSGPLSWIVRNDAKPGRERVAGLAHWVVHATASSSQTQLESPPADVLARLQEALARWLGEQLNWHHAAVPLAPCVSAARRGRRRPVLVGRALGLGRLQRCAGRCGCGRSVAVCARPVRRRDRELPRHAVPCA